MTRTSSLAWVLLGLCLSRPALADQPTAIPRATKPQVHQAVDRATKHLQTESAAWLNTRKCAACHHVPMSWPMISRSTPNGEAGSSKLLTPITCTASSWASLGLVRLVPKKP